MTKQEYEAKNQQLRDAYICDSDYFGRLVDVDSEYIASLEAEIAQLKKDKLEFNAQCFHKDETISVLKNRITELEFDNRSLVEQMNAQSEQIKLLNTALDIAAEDIDFDVLGTCPNEFDYGCPFGECKFSDNKPHENNCWKQAFIKAAEKHLRGEK